MKEIIAFVRDVDEEEKSEVCRSMREELSAKYFHRAITHLRDMGNFHGGEIVFVKDDGSPVEASRIRINVENALIDEKITQWS